MNIYQELKKLNVKYGNDPTTATCFLETLALVKACQDILLKPKLTKESTE